jgi:hypothetical protein
MNLQPKILNAREVGTKLEGSVYCGRPSKYGNPFKTGIDGNRTEVIEKHRIWFLSNQPLIDQAKNELRGTNLICWCAPKSCHCDIILEVANQSDLFGFM